MAEERQTSIPNYARPDLLGLSELVGLIHLIDFARSNKRLHEALYQLHSRGPVWDGDVISKSDRNALIGIDACAKVCVKGQDGFNACTYHGRSLLHIYDWLYGPLDNVGEAC
jgi:hypothetical protein